MGLADLEVFIREKLTEFDGMLDVSAGSALDQKLVQPLLSRLGVDPFSVDIPTFILSRLQQERPDLVTHPGSAVSDTFVTMSVILLDPIVREISRVARMQSFRNADLLTTDEVDALGANFFETRNVGRSSRGVARLYFAQAQNVTCTPTQFCSTADSLNFFVTDTQQIRLEEMRLNKEGDSYYFDITVMSEKPGSSYNIPPGSLISISNLPSVVRVTNKSTFNGGLDAATSAEFVQHIEDSLAEKSLTTEAGIVNVLDKYTPAVTHTAVVGFGDAEMQRDIVHGGGLGPVVMDGTSAYAMPDGLYGQKTTHVCLGGATVSAVIGGVGPATGWVLTVFIGGAALDVPVVSVVNINTVALSKAVIPAQQVGIYWTLRRHTLSVDGVEYTSGMVHAGCKTDVYVRAESASSETVVLSTVSDEAPELHGQAAQLVSPTAIQLTDYPAYAMAPDNPDYAAFQSLVHREASLVILTGPSAGTYRITEVILANNAAPIIGVENVPHVQPGNYAWHISSEIHVSLVDPKTIKFAGTDGQSQSVNDQFISMTGVNYAAYGVAAGDTLVINTGPDAGEYSIKAIGGTAWDTLTLSKRLTATYWGLSYSIVKRSASKPLQLPLLRIDKVELLNSSAQPIGVTVPPADPLGVVSSSFSHIGKGVRFETSSAILGIVSRQGPFRFLTPAILSFHGSAPTGIVTFDVPVQGTMTAQQIAQAINSAAAGTPIAASVQGLLMVYPAINDLYVSETPGSIVVFGPGVHTTRDMRLQAGSWGTYFQHDSDVVHVMSGPNAGFYVPELQSSQCMLAEKPLLPAVHQKVRLGSRSSGVARMLFSEPTTVEVDSSTMFTTQVAGSTMRYLPDPAARRAVYPSADGTAPRNGASSGTVFTSAGTKFQSAGVKPGDTLTITYVGILGASLPAVVSGLEGKELLLYLGGTSDRSLRFVGDVATPGAVSRDGVIKQINDFVGTSVASLVADSSGNLTVLQLVSSSDIVVRDNSGPASALGILGWSQEVSNASAHAGEYTINAVVLSSLTVSPAFPPGTVSNQAFTITRRGVQRISTTDMLSDPLYNDLFVANIELLSEGVGDDWNIPEGTVLEASGYKGYGYRVTSEDENTTFSTKEKPVLRLTTTIVEPGVDDIPGNATQLSGQSIGITYKHAPVVSEVQNVLSAASLRIVTADMLARHLVPHFVRLAIKYAGKPTVQALQTSLSGYINKLAPDAPLSVDDLLVYLRQSLGASSVETPINLMVFYMDMARKWHFEQSENAVSTGRLAAFMVDQLRITKR